MPASNPELREFFARAAPGLDLDRPEVRAELRRRVRLRTATIAQLSQLAIGTGSAAHGVRAPTLIVQGKADRVVRARDTRASRDASADRSRFMSSMPGTCCSTRPHRAGQPSETSSCALPRLEQIQDKPVIASMQLVA